MHFCIQEFTALVSGLSFLTYGAHIAREYVHERRRRWARMVRNAETA